MKISSLRRYNHPDLTDDVVHLTGRRGTPNSEVPRDISELSAEARLQEILRTCRIRGFAVFGNRAEDRVVCFSEATPAGLGEMVRSQRYDALGIGFSKDSLVKRGGGPALYVRGDEFEAARATLPQATRAKLTRFWPGAEPDGDERLSDSKRVASEWAYEREWRVPLALGEDFSFEPDDVELLILPASGTAPETNQLVSDLPNARLCRVNPNGTFAL